MSKDFVKENNALLELADLANCVGGDFHLLHLNCKGVDFDSMHRKTLKKYYEQAAEDFDSFAEAACSLKHRAFTPNESAKRIDYQSLEPLEFDRKEAVKISAVLLEQYCKMLMKVFNHFNKIDECPICIGIANLLQTRLEYWSKEWAYFNYRRED